MDQCPSYPDTCLRGIPNSSFLVDGRFLSAHLFYFESRDIREDGWSEQSVNWQDDAHALAFTLGQLKDDGQKQFQAGVAAVSRHELDRIRERFVHMGVFSYERRPLDLNPYHGNILLEADKVRSPLMKQIAATLALYSQYVSPEECAQ